MLRLRADFSWLFVLKLTERADSFVVVFASVLEVTRGSFVVVFVCTVAAATLLLNWVRVTTVG